VERENFQSGGVWNEKRERKKEEAGRFRNPEVPMPDEAVFKTKGLGRLKEWMDLKLGRRVQSRGSPGMSWVWD
jgi:hypothetical protein